MISHKHKCIYIHIPKCAGTSVEKALGHLDGHVGREGQDHRIIRNLEKPSLNKYVFSSMVNLKLFVKNLMFLYSYKVDNPNNKNVVGKQQYENYFKFTIVRNPWSRAVSVYKNILRDDLHKNNYGVPQDISFQDFLKMNLGKNMLRPQTFWLKDYAGKISLDYVGKFEDLNTVFDEIKKKIDANDIEFLHKLKSTVDDYRDYYDEESKKLITDFFEEEILLFKYSFDS
jgi:hypothetical protein